MLYKIISLVYFTFHNVARLVVLIKNFEVLFLGFIYKHFLSLFILRSFC